MASPSVAAVLLLVSRSNLVGCARPVDLLAWRLSISCQLAPLSAKAVSIACGVAAFTATISTPNADAPASTRFNTRGLAELPGFNNTATRVIFGEKAFNSSSCFVLISTSMTDNPVMLRPGRAGLRQSRRPLNRPQLRRRLEWTLAISAIHALRPYLGHNDRQIHPTNSFAKPERRV